MMPEDAAGTAIDVTKDFAEPTSLVGGLSKKAAKAVAAGTREVDALAAYDITLTANGEEYQPDNKHPLRVRIASHALDEAAVRDKDLQLWHVTDGGDIEDVMAAAKKADVHDNISEFSEGYQTVLGERGVTVSGGQKQRISIARALMKNAPILILDDAVSAVDVKTERAILSELRETRRGKTTILIAHRISTVENMDKIIFIDDGEIVAVGTHTELLTTCPAYKTMVELQKLDDLESGTAKVGN
jgi:ATP-binding cassette subfamily B protein